MFQIDANHPTPLYAQLGRSIRFAIATGKLRIGDQLPTVRQLAVELRINANTVAKVYGELERSGDRHLRELADHFITETHTRGFTIDDVIEHLESRRRKVTQVAGLRSGR